MVQLSKIEVTGDGQWFEYYVSPDDENDKIELLIGSSASESYRKLQRKLGRVHAENNVNTSKRFGQKVKISDADSWSSVITLNVHLLKGWRGIEMTHGDYAKLMGTDLADGQDPNEVFVLVWSPDHARALLSNGGFGDMLEFVAGCGNDIAKHTKQHVETAVGNSQKSSSSS